MFNNVTGFSGPLFDWSAQPSSATPCVDPDSAEAGIDQYDQLASTKKKHQELRLPDAELEGFHDDPPMTKVVDRRWYEKNKHIFPASVWEEYSPDKMFTKAGRKDAEGNRFFFS